MDEKILVIGGTRGTGRLIVGRLLASGRPVRVLARSVARARAALPEGVEIAGGDLTRPETLFPAMEAVSHVIFTAGVTGGPAGEAVVRATVHDGVRGTLAAMQRARVRGRFLYMTTVGLTRSSPLALLLDLMRRGVRKWRRLAEVEIRSSDLDYTILRAGLLTNDPPGQRAIVISQEECALDWGTRISRADVAEVFVAALQEAGTRRTTLNVIGGRHPLASLAGTRPASDAWREALGRLHPDD
jgi:uncharacterized protein YbjT (DUF2867 family)